MYSYLAALTTYIIGQTYDFTSHITLHYTIGCILAAFVTCIT